MKRGALDDQTRTSLPLALRTFIDRIESRRQPVVEAWSELVEAIGAPPQQPLHVDGWLIHYDFANGRMLDRIEDELRSVAVLDVGLAPRPVARIDGGSIEVLLLRYEGLERDTLSGVLGDPEAITPETVGQAMAELRRLAEGGLWHRHLDRGLGAWSIARPTGRLVVVDWPNHLIHASPDELRRRLPRVRAELDFLVESSKT